MIGKKIDLILFEVTLRNILGFVILVLLLISKVFVSLAVFLTNLIDVFWNYILPWGLVIAIIIAILVGVVFISLPVYASQVLKGIKKWAAERKEKRAQDKQDINREVLDTTTEELLAA